MSWVRSDIYIKAFGILGILVCWRCMGLYRLKTGMHGIGVSVFLEIESNIMIFPICAFQVWSSTHAPLCLPFWVKNRHPPQFPRRLKPQGRYKYLLPPTFSLFFFLSSSTLRAHIALRGSLDTQYFFELLQLQVHTSTYGCCCPVKDVKP